MPIVIGLLQLKLCAHDDIMAGKAIPRQEVYDTGPNSGTRWQNIRIRLDFRYFFESSTDKYTCRYKGQKLSYKNGDFVCNETDVLTPKKRARAIRTLQNVKSFAERFIQTVPVDSPFVLQNYSDETAFINEKVYGTDLHVTILTRPKSYMDAVAAAMPTSIDTQYFRPLTGVIILNPSEIPDEVQSENTESNRYFYLLLHELFHVLGITPPLFQYYHPYGTNSFHTNINCSLTRNNKNFQILITPNAKKFAKKHYGVDTFNGDRNRCAAGIEFEDAPGQGSHLESRTYYTEVMTAGNYLRNYKGEKIKQPFYRLTEATLAVLEDTGNYKCDYKMVQHLLWGNPLLNKGKPIENFAIGPPQTTFPKYYLSNQVSGTGFDFKHLGSFDTKRIDCDNEDHEKPLCKLKDFYNPQEWEYMADDQIPDYMPQPKPEAICPKGTAMLPNNYNFADFVRCGEYKCNGYESFNFTLTYDNSNNLTKDIHCTRDNVDQEKLIYISSDSDEQPVRFWCPDPERFCKTMELYDQKFTEHPFLYV